MCTYGNVVGIESMAETKSVTQHSRGDEGPVKIRLGAFLLWTLSGSRTHESATTASARRVRAKCRRSQTRRIPTATQTIALANTKTPMILTAGYGSFRNPGVCSWYAISLLLTALFRARSPMSLDWRDLTGLV